MVKRAATERVRLEDDYRRVGYVKHVYDGDTIFYDVDLGYQTWVVDQAGRMLNTWAQEIKPLNTREAGTAARDCLRQFIDQYAINRNDAADLQQNGPALMIQSAKAPQHMFRKLSRYKKEKYGRWLVTLYGIDDRGQPVNINNLMVESGHATFTAEG